jgi:protein-histidine N-methyltransferase
MRHESNQVDFQDYNEQVLQYITIPNIILNTVVAPSEASAADEKPEIERSDIPQDNAHILEQGGQDDEDEDEDEDEPHADEEEMDSADAELDISETQAPDILSKLSQRSQCYFGEWQSLTVSIAFSQVLGTFFP